PPAAAGAQVARVHEPAVHADEPRRGGPEAVIGDEHDGGVRPRRADERADAGVEKPVDGPRRRRDLRRDRGVDVPGRPSAEVVPEEVLDAVRLVEDHAEEVPRPLAHEPLRHRDPALREPAEVVQVLEAAGAIVGRAADEAPRRLDRDLVVGAEEVADVGRPGDVGRARRREEARDHEPVHRSDRPRGRYVDGANGAAGRADDVPERPRAERLGGHEVAARVAVCGEGAEAEDAVLAGVLARDERRPRRRRERGDGRRELAVAASVHEGGELRQLARRDPRREEAEARPVEPDDEDAPRDGAHDAAARAPSASTSAQSARYARPTASQVCSRATFARPRAASAAAAAGASRSRPSAAASAAASSGGTRSPVSPSATSSGMPFTQLATTGRPAASASTQTSGRPSKREGQATTAAPWKRATVVARSVAPRKRTRDA